MTAADPITTMFMLIAVGIIMLGLGLSLRVADFARVLTYPRAVLVGLICQILLLPLVAIGIAHSFDLEPNLAIGLMLLAASPGGITANLYSHLANGDLALNITLTAINSVLAIVTLPLIVNLSMLHFMDSDSAVPLQFGKVFQVFLIVLGPVVVGMWLYARYTVLAERLRKPVKLLSVLFLATVIGLAMFKARGEIGSYLRQVGSACLIFSVLSLVIGYSLPRFLRLGRRQSIAIGMEVGIHNTTLSIAIAMSPMMLGNPTMAIPAAVYGVMMHFPAASFAWLISRRQKSYAGEFVTGEVSDAMVGAGARKAGRVILNERCTSVVESRSGQGPL